MTTTQRPTDTTAPPAVTGEEPDHESGPAACPAERPLRADARRNRERILQAAREVFAEFGVEAQIDDVARRAGVGVGTVYRHFPTKEALLAELVRNKFRLFTENALAALDEDGEPFEVLEGLLRRNSEICARDAGVQQALSGYIDQIWPDVEPDLQALIEPTAELLERARRAGTLRPDVTVSDIPMLMCGVSATMTANRAGFDWQRHLELVIGMLRRCEGQGE